MSSRRLRREAEALRELQVADEGASTKKRAEEDDASGSEDISNEPAGLSKPKALGFAAVRCVRRASGTHTD